jgi:MFS family permease
VSFIATPTSKASVKEGSLDAVKVGVAETYFGAFGVFLGGTPMQVGALATLPPLVGAMTQVWGMRLAERAASRRDAAVRCIQLQAALLSSLLLVQYLFGVGWWALVALIGLVSLYQMTNGLLAPVWNSLMGDLIPPTSRGEFFGYRNTWVSIVTFVSVILGGQLIHISSLTDRAALGFCAVFAIGAYSRFLSASWLARLPDEALHVPAESKFSFWQFIRRAKQSNFVRFALFTSAMNFAASLSGPYFAMYMLNDLRMSYYEYTLAVSAVVLVQFAVMRSWGRLSDQFGNRKILGITGALVSVNPLLWLVSSKLWFVILIQLYSGLFWAGFNLAAANFVFDAVSPQKRARCFAYQSIINGWFVFLGSVLGGLAATQLPRSASEIFSGWVNYSPFLVLFVLSALARVLTMVLLFPRFKEVRTVQKIRSYELLIRVTSLRPLWGATFSFISERRKRRE